MLLNMVKTLNRCLETLCGVCLALMFLIGSYLVYDTLWLMRHAQDPTLKKYRPQDDVVLEEERKIGPEQAGWITIEGTGIDYPVMQSSDNIKYLQTDPYGDLSMSGSIFLDCRNDADLADPYSIIYGHHMENGLMFGALDSFRDEGFLVRHREGRITTRQACYMFHVFCTTEADAATSGLFRPLSREEALAALRAEPMWFEEPKEGQIVALSTCVGAEESSRFLVVGTIEEIQ